MATVAKARKPQGEVARVMAAAAPAAASTQFDDMTVEQFLELKFEEMMKEFRGHSDGLISKLKGDYEEGARKINSIINVQSSSFVPISVLLKVISGQHIGQKFRLELAPGMTEDCFKMGRSTGKHFKEKGVSLYKDKEISTTHGKLELKNGQAFFIDNDSTNGSSLNNVDCTPSLPYLLKDGDVICMGSTEMQVQIFVGENQENAPADNY